jgi:hypothetical protein
MHSSCEILISALPVIPIDDLAWVIDLDGFSTHPFYLNFSYHSNLDPLDRACGEKEGFSEGGYY